jgi:hypothetical protein
MKWQFFEKLAAFVFEQNDYEVSMGIVKKFGCKNRFSKRQYDIIAENPRHVFAVDCKRWTGRRYKSSQLRVAAEKHIERCILLKRDSEKEIIPLIVTLMQEGMVVHDGVPIVPIEMLNTFLNTWEECGDEIRKI